MEMEEFKDDLVLRRLLNNTPMESPSEGFTTRVMAAVEAHAAAPTAEEAPSLLQRLRSALPWLGVAALVTLFIYTSDLPFTRYLAGSEFITSGMMPYVDALVAGLTTLFSSSYVTFALGIGLSAGFLVFLDYLFTRRSAAGQPS